MGYTKNIAVIKGLLGGFSADGGPLSGLVKAEKYSSELRIEVSLINFAPLSEGRYVVALSDGPHTQIVEDGLFEGSSEVDTSQGFAAAVCYVNGTVQLIASAVCGNFHAAAFGLKTEIERAEKIKSVSAAAENKESASGYEDEALAEENYYEFGEVDENGGAVFETAQEKEDGNRPAEDEENSHSVGGGQTDKGGRFYGRMRAEIERVLSDYPPSEELCAAVEDSRWVEISYGGDNFYVFGVIVRDGRPRYICYGIPTSQSDVPPAGMRGMAAFLDVKTQHGTGFWVMYQDADTGERVRCGE